jgi:hypothetical protein
MPLVITLVQFLEQYKFRNSSGRTVFITVGIVSLPDHMPWISVATYTTSVGKQLS